MAEDKGIKKTGIEIQYQLTGKDGKTVWFNAEDFDRDFDDISKSYGDRKIRVKGKDNSLLDISISDYKDALEEGYKPYILKRVHYQQGQSQKAPANVQQALKNVQTPVQSGIKSDTTVLPETAEVRRNANLEKETQDANTRARIKQYEQATGKKATDSVKQAIADTVPTIEQANAGYYYRPDLRGAEGRSEAKDEFDAFFDNNIATKYKEAENEARQALASDSKRIRDVYKYVDASIGDEEFNVAVERHMDPAKIAERAFDKIDKDALGAYVMSRLGIDPNSKGGAKTTLSKQEQQMFQNAYGKMFQKVAGEIQQRMYDDYAKANAPKSTLEYILGSAFRGNIITQLSQGFNRIAAGSSGIKQQLIDKAYADYGEKAGPIAQGLAAGATLIGNMPAFGVSGKAASAVTKGVTRLAAKPLAAKIYNSGFRIGMKEATDIAARLIAQNPAMRLTQSAISGGVNFGTYNVMSATANQIRNGEYSIGQTLAEGTEGLLTGAALGAFSRVLPSADRFATKAGRVAAGLGNLTAEGGFFTALDALQNSGEYIDENGIKWSALAGKQIENMTMVGMMKAPHLRNIFKRVRFADRYDMTFNKSDWQALKDIGYKVDNQAQFFADIAENKNPEGLSDADALSLQKMMADNRIPAKIRAKIQYTITGTIPILPVYGTAVNGKEVTTFGLDGEIETKKFFTRGQAEAYARQMEGEVTLNNIERVHQAAEMAEKVMGLEEGSISGKALDEVANNTGVDIEEALMKAEGKRTEVEKDAIREYQGRIVDSIEKLRSESENKQQNEFEQAVLEGNSDGAKDIRVATEAAGKQFEEETGISPDEVEDATLLPDEQREQIETYKEGKRQIEQAEANAEQIGKQELTKIKANASALEHDGRTGGSGSIVMAEFEKKPVYVLEGDATSYAGTVVLWDPQANERKIVLARDLENVETQTIEEYVSAEVQRVIDSRKQQIREASMDRFKPGEFYAVDENGTLGEIISNDGNNVVYSGPDGKERIVSVAELQALQDGVRGKRLEAEVQAEANKAKMESVAQERLAEAGVAPGNKVTLYDREVDAYDNVTVKGYSNGNVILDYDGTEMPMSFRDFEVQKRAADQKFEEQKAQRDAETEQEARKAREAEITAQREAESARIKAEEEKRGYPVDGEGNPDYKLMQANRETGKYSKALKEEFGDDASAIVDEQIADWKKQIDGFASVENAIDRARKTKAVQAEIDFLEGVKGEIERGGEKEKGISEIDAENKDRIKSWISPENIEWAKGKTRKEIFEHFGNDLEPVSYIPEKYVGLFGDLLTDKNVYSGKGYFIDHAVNHHPNVGVEEYLNIQEVLNNPDGIKEVNAEGKKTVAFTKKLDRWNAVLVQLEVGEDGKILLHKSFFGQKKEPYAKNNDIRSISSSLEGGTSSISPTDESAAAISLEGRSDVEFSADKDKQVSENEQAKEDVIEQKRENKLEGYLSDKTPTQKANIAKALSKETNYDGKVMTRQEFIEDAVENGRKFAIGSTNTGKPEYRAMNEDGSYWIITKSEYDYAAHLGGNMPTEADIEQAKNEARKNELDKKFEFMDNGTLIRRIQNYDKLGDRLQGERKEIRDEMYELLKLRGGELPEAKAEQIEEEKTEEKQDADNEDSDVQGDLDIEIELYDGKDSDDVTTVRDIKPEQLREVMNFEDLAAIARLRPDIKKEVVAEIKDRLNDMSDNKLQDTMFNVNDDWDDNRQALMKPLVEAEVSKRQAEKKRLQRIIDNINELEAQRSRLVADWATADKEKKDEIQKEIDAKTIERDEAVRAVSEEDYSAMGSKAPEVLKRRMAEVAKSKAEREAKKELEMILGNAENPEPAKVDKFKIKDFVVSDKSDPRDALKGVYHDEEGYAVATDAVNLAAIKSEFKPEYAGKIIDSDGKEIEARFPKWRNVIPDKGMKTYAVDMGVLAAAAKSAIERNKTEWKRKKDAGEKVGTFKSWSPADVIIDTPDGMRMFGAYELQKFVSAAEALGCKEISIPEGGKLPMVAKNENGVALVMPKLMDENPSFEIENGGLRVNSLVTSYVKVGQEPAKASDKKESAPVASATPESKSTEKAKSPKTEAVATDKAAEKIEDVGEKIGGARKDVVFNYAKRANIEGTKLSEIFPKPNFKTMLKGGMDAETLATVKAYYMLAKALAKNKRLFERRNIGVVRTLSQAVQYLLAEKGGLDTEHMATQAGKLEFSKPIVEKYGYIEAVRQVVEKLGEEYLDVDFLDVAVPSEERFVEDGNGYYLGADGKSYVRTTREDGRSMWSANGVRKLFETKEDAFANYVERVGKAHDAKTAAPKRKINLYMDRLTGKCFIATRIGGEIVRLKDGFDKVADARAYLDANETELQVNAEQIAKDRRQGGERKKSNDEMERELRDVVERDRIGKDWRQGRDVGAEDFMKEFGFRGVEFGNWASQAERQLHLNKCYDALKDMADLMGVSPMALSLGGKLGFAFGARGHSKALAHYEPGSNVINLTKRRGAGCVAHEWFHAMDFYLSGDVFRPATAGAFKPETRDALKEAMRRLMDGIRGTEYEMFAKKLDAGKEKNYWSEATELGARAFESYIKTRLMEQGRQNDYLSNFACETVIDGTGSYYPMGEELKAINEAYDAFVDTMEERLEDGVPYLYSKANREPGTEVETEAQRIATEFVMDAAKQNEAVGVKTHVLTTEQAREELAKMEDEESNAMLSKKQKRALETASLSQSEDHPTVVSSADGANVLQRLKETKEKLLNISNKSKTFIGDIAKALGAKRHNSNSEYATFETKNGKIVTIRLADHNATISTFDNHGEYEGISIVVTPNPNSGIINNGNAHIIEFFYDSTKIRRSEGKPLADIVSSIEQSLYSGEYKDTTGLAEVEEVNARPMFSKVSDKETIEWFEKQPKKTAYRAMQVIDGKLYPPMAAMIDGKMVDGAVPGDILEADENPDHVFATIKGEAYRNAQGKLAYRGRKNVPASEVFEGSDGKYYWKSEAPENAILMDKDNPDEIAYKFILDKGVKDATGKKAVDVPARYNPYWHMSNSVLNDQFKSAWIRPNMVVVEVEFPENELTSGYKAQYAKDAVGLVPWKSGSVTGELVAQGHPGREVYLSRYCKIKGVLSDKQAAQKIKEFVGGYDVEIPENTVTPQLATALKAEGVKIGKPEKGVNKSAQIQKAIEDGLSVVNEVRFQRTSNDNVFVTNAKARSLSNMFKTWTLEEMYPEVKEYLETRTNLYEKLGETDEDIMEYMDGLSEAEYNKVKNLYRGLQLPSYNEFHSDRDYAEGFADEYRLSARGIAEKKLEDAEWLKENAPELVSAVKLGEGKGESEAHIRKGLGLDNEAGVSGSDADIDVEKLFLPNSNGVSFHKLSSGTVYGWTKNGEIYLTPAGVNPNTPVHEYVGHVWGPAVRKNNPELWENIKEHAKQTPIWKEVMADKEYEDIKENEDLVTEEVIGRGAGRKNARLLNEKMEEWIKEEPDMMKKAEKASIWHRLKAAITDALKWINQHVFKIKKFNDFEEVLDKGIYDFYNKTDLRGPEDDGPGGGKIESHDVAKINTEFNEALDAIGTENEPVLLNLGTPGNILRSTGVPGLPIEMSVKRLKEKATSFGHNYDYSDIKDLVVSLQNPLAVFAYGDKNKAQNVIVEIQKDDNNFIVGLSFSPQKGKIDAEVTKVSVRNVFPKKNAEWLNWISQGKALFLDKEKIKALIDKQRTILADVDYLDLDDVANKVNNFDNPKETTVKFSRTGDITDDMAERARIDEARRGLGDRPKQRQGESKAAYLKRLNEWLDAQEGLDEQENDLDPEPKEPLPLEGEDIFNDNYMERYQEWMQDHAEWERRQQEREEAEVARQIEERGYGNGPESVGDRQFREMMDDAKIKIDEGPMERRVKEQIRERRRFIQTSNWEDAKTLYELRKKTTPEQRKALPFILEGVNLDGVPEQLKPYVDEAKSNLNESEQRGLANILTQHEEKNAILLNPTTESDLQKVEASLMPEDIERFKADKENGLRLSEYKTGEVTADHIIARYGDKLIIPSEDKLPEGMGLVTANVGTEYGKLVNLDGRNRKIVARELAPNTGGVELTPELQEVAKEIRAWFDREFTLLNNMGMFFGEGNHKLDNYVTHIWDRKKSDPVALRELTNRLRTSSQYTKHRVIETISDGIEAGLVPKYEDIADIMADYGHTATEAIANKQFLDFLKMFEIDGNPILKPVTDKDPDYQRMQNETLEEYRVYKPLVSTLSIIFGKDTNEDSRLAKAWRVYDTAGATLKKINLAMSLFHHVALSESGVAILNPLGFMKVIGKNIIWDAACKRHVPAFNDPSITDDAVKHFVQLGATNDYAAKEVQRITGSIRKSVQGTAIASQLATALDLMNRGMDKALWDYLHDGLKLYAYDKMAKQVRKEGEKKGYSSDIIDKQLDEVGQLVNDMFGGQFFDILSVSPQMEKVLRRLMLSPDWNISAVRQALAPFGIGSMYSKKDFIDMGLSEEEAKNVMEDIKRPRKHFGRVFWITAGVFFTVTMNSLNALLRAWDEHNEKKKAEEIRKYDPDYRSPYELAYPNGMKWYDYTWYGNTYKTFLFAGRYSDGTERYIRWGKQFREVPELFLGHDFTVSFPDAAINKIAGKVNPVINFMSNFLFGHSINGYKNQWMKDREGSLDMLIGRAQFVAASLLPKSIPTDEEKEWVWTDIMMPSSKGMTPYKARKEFEDAIKSGSAEAMAAVYSKCVMNNLNGEELFNAAISVVESEARKDLLAGVESLQDAYELFDKETDAKKRSQIERYIKKHIRRDEYRAISVDEFMDNALNGTQEEDVKKYNKYKSSVDVMEDIRLQGVVSKHKQEFEKWKKSGESFDKASARVRAYAIAREGLSELQGEKRAMNKGNLAPGTYLNRIRKTRKAVFDELDKIHLK